MAGRRSKAVPATVAGKRKRFLEVLRDTANISEAARQAGWASSTVYRQRARNEAFRTAWEEAANAAIDTLEAALLKRAVDGVARPVLYAGKRVATVTTYSDALGMFLLKTRRPEVYAGIAGATGQPNEDDADAELLEVERRLDQLAGRGVVAA